MNEPKRNQNQQDVEVPYAPVGQWMGPVNNYDDEVGGSQMDFSDKTIRRGFIRKVYCILMAQLTLVVGFIAIFLYVRQVGEWTKENLYFLFGALVIKIIFLIVLVCCDSVRRQFPTNFICLGIFTLLDGFLIGFITSFYDEQTVLIAVGITAFICFGLTLFSFQTKYDVTGWGGYLFVLLIVLILFGILAAVLKSPILHLVYACAGALLFAFYLVYDTQLMIGGSHKYSISPEEYIYAALNLYVDIINLFLYILRIVAAIRS